MSDPSAQVTDPGHPTATLRCGEVETAFVCLGSGRPYVVLRELGTQHAWLEAAVTVLASRGRMYIAEVPSHVASALGRGDEQALVSGWLRSLLDGFGLEGATIVCGAGLTPPLLGFVLSDPDRVHALVTLARSPAPDPGTVRAAGSLNGRPLLVVQAGREGWTAAIEELRAALLPL